VPSEQVIEELRGTYTTLSSLSSTLSLVRSAVRDLGHQPPEDFKLSREEVLTLKRKSEQAVILKNESLIIVRDFAALLHAATCALRSATPQCSYSRLILPLLLVSGRRLTEICSPRSIFTPMPDEHYAAFQGV
jgi:hypothetical protein